MIVLIFGLVLFFAIHSISIINEPWRDSLVRNMGEGSFKGIYSLIAAVGLGLIIWGYGLARQDPVAIWLPPSWLRHVSLMLLIPVFPLLLATYFPGRIKAIVKNPMLISVKLWALAHLLSNGMLADLLLFGTVLVWAIIDLISVKKRKARKVPALPSNKFNDVIAVVGGLILYVAFVKWLHFWLIGVMPVTPAG